MEYVLVKYPVGRKVLVDGKERGLTNVILRTNKGTHSFDLGEPVDYRPESVEVYVGGTTSIKPLEVVFEKI
jgi:hypothetical protein